MPPAKPVSSLGIVIPAFNERSNLADTFLEAHDHLKGRVEILEFVLVDDGSTDGTYEEMQRLAQAYPGVTLARHDGNRGLGAAVWTGVGHVSAQWCTWLPADGQVAPDIIARLAERAGPGACVVFVRQAVYASPWRRVLTAGIRMLLRLVASFDLQNYSGIYLAETERLRQVPYCGNSTIQNYAVPIWLRDAEVALRMVEGDIRARRHGRSKVANLRTILRTLLELLKLRLRIGRGADTTQGVGPPKN